MGIGELFCAAKALRPNALAHHFESEDGGGGGYVEVGFEVAAIGDSEQLVAQGEGGGVQAAAFAADEQEKRAVKIDGIEGFAFIVFGGGSDAQAAAFEERDGFFGIGHTGGGHVFRGARRCAGDDAEGGIPVALGDDESVGAGCIQSADGLAVVKRILDAVQHGDERRAW